MTQGDWPLEMTGATASTDQVVLAQVEWAVGGEDLKRNHALSVSQGLCTGVSRAGKCCEEYDSQTRGLLEEVIAGYSGC